MKDVIIIGAGIAGLSAGFELYKNNIEFQVLETSNRVGGCIETIKINGCLLESGPHTFSSLSTETLDLVKELGIENSLLTGNPQAKKDIFFLIIN